MDREFPAAVRPTSQLSAWYGIAAAPLAWLAQELIGAVVASRVCEGDPARQVGTGVRAALLILALILFAVSISGAIIAASNWRQGGTLSALAHGQPRRVPDFLALAGMLASLMFSAAIVWAALPVLMLNPCARAL